MKLVAYGFGNPSLSVRNDRFVNFSRRSNNFFFELDFWETKRGIKTLKGHPCRTSHLSEGGGSWKMGHLLLFLMEFCYQARSRGLKTPIFARHPKWLAPQESLSFYTKFWPWNLSTIFTIVHCDRQELNNWIRIILDYTPTPKIIFKSSCSTWMQSRKGLKSGILTPFRK